MDRAELIKMIDDDEFGLLVAPVREALLKPAERLASSFLEITAFVDEHGREPNRNPADMSETKLAMRLQAMRDSDEQRTLLALHDRKGLLAKLAPPTSLAEVLADDSAQLLSDPAADELVPRHVPKTQTMPERIARRRRCEDFEVFEPLFVACHNDIRSGARRLLEFKNPSEIDAGGFFVLNGVLLYVADMGEKRVDAIKKANARLRCIFENGTESDLLLQSLASNLYKDGRRVTRLDGEVLEAMDLSAGTPMASVYVLRSLSDDPQIRSFTALHKIGSTKRTLEERVANASGQTTFLGGPVEVVAEYGVPRGTEKKIEGMLHRLFATARVDAWVENNGRAGGVEAREWFAVPLPAIAEAIQMIESGAIVNFAYDAAAGTFRLAASTETISDS